MQDDTSRVYFRGYHRRGTEYLQLHNLVNLIALTAVDIVLISAQSASEQAVSVISAQPTRAQR